MLVIDLIIIALTVGGAAWGFSRGLTTGMVALVAFGVGALLGSRIAPLVLAGGVHSSFAPVLALPGALMLGGLLAAAVERLALRHRVRFTGLGRANAAAGALLGGCLGLLASWLLGSAVAQIHDLRKPVQRSAILKRLNAALPPPGPVLVAEKAKLASVPILDAPVAQIRQPDPLVVRQRKITVAARSVVKVEVEGCDTEGSGSGWFAARSIVVTAAHVVAGVDSIRVRVHGQKSKHSATTVWYDARNDFALLRVPGLSRQAPLPIARVPKSGTSGAMLGFPAGGWDVRAARLGRTGGLGKMQKMDRPIAPGLSKRLVTAFAGKAQPGYSGGPIVDTMGRVGTTMFAIVGGQQRKGYGVPNRFVRSALGLAGPRVSNGACEQSG